MKRKEKPRGLDPYRAMRNFKRQVNWVKSSIINDRSMVNATVSLMDRKASRSRVEDLVNTFTRDFSRIHIHSMISYYDRLVQNMEFFGYNSLGERKGLRSIGNYITRLKILGNLLIKKTYEVVDKEKGVIDELCISQGFIDQFISSNKDKINELCNPILEIMDSIVKEGKYEESYWKAYNYYKGIRMEKEIRERLANPEPEEEDEEYIRDRAMEKLTEDEIEILREYFIEEYEEEKQERQKVWKMRGPVG